MTNKNIGINGKWLSINQCPKHGFYSVSIQDANGGHRLTGGKCCGYWKTIERWKVDQRMITEFIKETKDSCNDK